MDEKLEKMSHQYAAQLRELAQKIELGDMTSAEIILDDLMRWRENSLFQDLGRLTRDFHETLQNFRFDSNLSNLSEDDFPDARERLRHIITMTAQAADKSLTATEISMPICHAIKGRNAMLKVQWNKFINRDLNADEFRALSKNLGGLFDELEQEIPTLEKNLNEITMAQDFQDLTGQIIGRVIELVDNVETSLVNLIRLSGQHILDENQEKDDGKSDVSVQGPVVPGVDDDASIVSGQDEVDDLLSSLGF